MKVALVSPGYPPAPGGVESVVAHTAHALARAEAEVEVLTQERRRDLPGTAWDQGVLVRRFACNQAATWRIAPGLLRYLARNAADYDVVHGHSYHGLTGIAAALTVQTRRPGVPYVFSPHYHGTGHSTMRALLHRACLPVGRAAMASAQSVLCVSRHEAERVTAHFPEVVGRISVVPNAVDLATLRAAVPHTNEPPTVLSVGRLERYKSIDRLIRAFAALSRDDVQLVIIGTGPDRARLAHLAAMTSASVRFLGQVPDHELHRWLRTATVLCSLSTHEAYGLASAEALAAGARVVLSDIPAHRELADLGAVRLVHPEADAVQIAAALANALDTSIPAPNPAVPDWDEVAARLLALYGAAEGADFGSRTCA
ncbi:glycosyltransferase family 4 protein [Streptomyces sp. NPDC059680]|uniref:glycosyltransferase family 4 protein n=1 Tax=Streptomyces sp. NPDC059680 TaxID=3346904 RepID=UPI0036B86367